MANKSINEIAKDFLGIVRKNRVGTVLPYEMATILNQATEQVIGDKFKAIEFDKKAFSDLLPLKAVVKASIAENVVDTDDIFEQNRYVTLPTSFRRVIRLVAKFAGTTDPTKLILIRSNETTDILNGVFSRPDKYQIYYTFFNKGTDPSIKFYVGNVPGVLTYMLEYYKQPTVITEASIIATQPAVISEFGNEVVKEIVEMAALMYLERVQDARVQTFSNEINNK